MRFKITHHLQYVYSREVFVEPTTLRLKPRDDFSQKLENFRLDLAPFPAGRSEGLDLYNNPVTLFWHTKDLAKWESASHFTVETLNQNPFNYLITDQQVLKLPARYSKENRQALAPYLYRVEPDGAVDEMAKRLLSESDDNTLGFLYHMTDTLHRDFSPVVRLTGEALSPSKTLRRKEGACRDLAVLYVDLCRSLGIAARFVSGYKYDPGAKDSFELHAWAEVFLPGAGWRGYDPSLGLAVADTHIALASGPGPTEAAAVTGTYRGSDVLSKLSYQISMENLTQAEQVKVGHEG
jgi:transglutaminase-like putative cysteine protease